MPKDIFPKLQRRVNMNMAEKLDAIAKVLQDEGLCAEAMVAEISEIVYNGKE